MFPFFVLSTTVILLTLWGAGIFPGTLYIAATILCGGTLVISFINTYQARYTLPSFPICVCIIIWLILTALPLPRSANGPAGSIRDQQNGRVQKELTEAKALGIINGLGRGFSISRNRCGTWRMIIFVIAVFSAMGMSSSLSPGWKNRYLQFLVLLVSLVALLGIVGQHIKPQGSTLWWYFDVPYKNPVACFVNRNLFAGFVILLCPSALVLSTSYLTQKRMALGMLNLLCLIIMTAAIVGALSRGALVSYFLTLIVTVFSMLMTGRKTQGMVLCALTCIIFVAVGIALSQGFEKRVRSLRHSDVDHSVQERIAVWKDSIRVWQDYPLLGAGANAFRSVFPQYKSLKDPRSFNYAVNTYIQLLVEGGLFGFLLFLSLLASFTVKIGASFRQVRVDRDLIIGVLAGIVAAMLHAAVDLAPYIPLYSIVLGSLAGLALNRHQDLEETYPVVVGQANSGLNYRWRIGLSLNTKIMQLFSGFGLIIIAIIYFRYKLMIDHLDKSAYISTAFATGTG